MRFFKYTAFLLALLIIPASALAQADRLHVRKGNKLFIKGDFNGASLEYQKALSANDTNSQATYNLGCAALQLGNDSLAVEQFKPRKIAESFIYRKLFHIRRKAP